MLYSVLGTIALPTGDQVSVQVQGYMTFSFIPCTGCPKNAPVFQQILTTWEHFSWTPCKLVMIQPLILFMIRWGSRWRVVQCSLSSYSWSPRCWGDIWYSCYIYLLSWVCCWLVSVIRCYSSSFYRASQQIFSSPSLQRAYWGGDTLYFCTLLWCPFTLGIIIQYKGCPHADML